MFEGSQTIIVHNGKILIAKRSPHKKIAPERWNFIGGKVEDTDINPEYGAIREVEEEVGLALKHYDLVLVSKKVVSWDGNEPFICHTFMYFIDDISSLKLNHEHSEYKWIPIEDFEKYNVIGYSKEEVNQEVISHIEKTYSCVV